MLPRRHTPSSKVGVAAVSRQMRRTSFTTRYAAPSPLASVTFVDLFSGYPLQIGSFSFRRGYVVHESQGQKSDGRRLF